MLTAFIGRLRRSCATTMFRTSGFSSTLGEASSSSRCIPIPLLTACAYKERPSLSERLQESLKRVPDDVESAHAVAVTGPEGTGKSQLVLRFIEEIANCLHCNALASDLAAARIKADLENGEDLAAALERYLLDYRYFYKRLLLDRDFADAGEHTKAIRTACAVSLASLREICDARSNSFPIELLTFMTFLDQGGIQDELCRLSSLSLDEACKRLHFGAPEWMQGLFGRDRDSNWDDTAYRTTTEVLWRYRLITPVGEPWKGFTMHSAVRRQASKSLASPDFWESYIVFMASACAQSEKEVNSAHFRRHLILHLPSNDKLPGLDAVLDIRGLRWLWSTIARVLSEAHKWSAAEELGIWVIEASSRLSGKNHLDTIIAMANLATLYYSQGRWTDAKLLDIEVLSASSTVLGEEHSDTITAMDSLAATYKSLGRPQEAKSLLIKILKCNIKKWGFEHYDTKTAMSNLLAEYWHSR